MKITPKKIVGRIVYIITLVVLALLFAFPLIWMIVSSFKTDKQIFADISGLSAFWVREWPEDILFNFKEMLAKLPLVSSMLTSVLYIAVIIACGLLVNSLAGYAFAKMKVPFKNTIFSIILGIMIIPAQTVMLTQFSIIYELSWTDSYLGLIIPAIASPLYIFLFRQYFLSIPDSIEEAARIDGAGSVRIFFQLVMPLAKPIYGTVTILSFIAQWNDFIWPVMVISSPEKQTVQMALNTLFSLKPVNYGNVMAGLTFVTIPVLILFLCMQKYYVQGIASTGIKE